METINSEVFGNARKGVIEILDDLVWVGTERGFSTIDRISKQVLRTSLITDVFTKEASKKYLLPMINIAIDSYRGFLWLAIEEREEDPDTLEGQITEFVYQYNGTDIKKFARGTGLPEDWPLSSWPHCITVNREGAVWFGFLSGIVYRFDGTGWSKWVLGNGHHFGKPRIGFNTRGDTYVAVPHAVFMIKDETCQRVMIHKDHPSCIHIDRNNAVWMGTSGNGVLIIKGDAATATRLGGGDSGGIASIIGIEEDSMGDLWIGTSMSLVQVERNTFELKEHRLEGKIPGSIISFKIDKEDNFWLISLPYTLLFMERGEILAPEREFKEVKGRFDGLPIVRVTHLNYAISGRDHELERMGKICEKRLRGVDESGMTEFQEEVITEMIGLGNRLNEDGLERYLRNFMKITPRFAIPVIAEKIIYKGRNAWFIEANWGFEFMDYVHFFQGVIDEETGEVLWHESCC